MIKKIRKGFSLVEMLLVIGVLSVLLIGMFVIYPNVRDSYQVKQEVDNLSLIKAGLSNYFESKGSNYSSLGTMQEVVGNRFANRARIVPESMNRGSSTTDYLNHVWGGDVIIHGTIGAYAQYQPGRTFAIRYNDVPSRVCVKLGTGAASLFSAMTVNSKPVINLSDNPSATPGTGLGVLDLPQLTQLCSSSDPVQFVFISN